MDVVRSTARHGTVLHSRNDNRTAYMQLCLSSQSADVHFLLLFTPEQPSNRHTERLTSETLVKGTLNNYS